MKLTNKQVATIQSYLEDKPVKRAYVFGSYSRGEANAESDIDLLVELNYELPIGLLFVRMKLELEELLEHPVDLVTSASLSRHLLPVVDREKQLIYAR